ncbi:MAG: GntR family transcriptional regulator/MocR family aminotransferase [Arcticibacterium sp.]|jgi:GntR family transcriptional regulator/MocR family aminotransferase
MFQIDKSASKAVFLQIADQLKENIRNGILPANTKLPGSRRLAVVLDVHRKTVLAAFEELINQGWLETKLGSGTYVAEKIEGTELEKLKVNSNGQRAKSLKIPKVLIRDIPLVTQHYHLDDGLPDPRLAPTKELNRAYKTALFKGNLYNKFTYGDIRGNAYLREQLVDYLFKTRGMKVSSEQILITRGVTQALYLSIQTFVKKGDKVAMPELNWTSAQKNFEYHGAEVVKIKVDKDGLDINHLEELLKEENIKMLYVTPHHQYPTTVIMPAYRRVKLMQLAKQYGFYVFEDDYDYDFHYTSHPIMPLAATHHGDYVLYAGSFTKAISPVFRVGYLVAHKEQIDYMAGIRRLIDRQGDNLLELAIAELLELGIIQRYLKKNRKIYESRRDIFCTLLEKELGNYLSFKKPEGGMSVWTAFKPEIDLGEIALKALKKDMYFSDGFHHSVKNFTRLGFASSNEDELQAAIKIVKELL